MAPEKLGLEEIGKIDKVKKISQEVSRPEGPSREANKDYFEALMNQKRVKVDHVAEVQKQSAKQVENSLFDEVRELSHKVDGTAKISPVEVASQAESLVAQIDTIKDQLSAPGIQIKDSVQTLLRNKLSHIDESLKVALNRAGVEYKPPEKSTSMAGPIDRFLGMLTNAQNQLQTLGSDIRTLAADSGSFTPATLLVIQMKVGLISQQMELFTSMLNKALESTKTLMNVQV